MPDLSETVEVLTRYWVAGGWLMLPLAAVTLLIWTQYLLTAQRLRRDLRLPPNVAAALAEHLPRCAAAAPPAWLASAPGATPRVLRHVLARTRAGLPYRDAFEQCRHAELAPYAHAFIVLAAFTAAAPLLGLLGTVLGMVGTFNAVALQSGETADMVARGISQALITTQVGLVAALPGTFGLAHLHRLRQRLKHQIDSCECQVLLICRNAGIGDGVNRRCA